VNTLVASAPASGEIGGSIYNYQFATVEGFVVEAIPILTTDSPGPYVLQTPMAGQATLVDAFGNPVPVAFQATPESAPPLVTTPYVLCVEQPLTATLILQDGGTLQVQGVG
jgi:hypothetical protein